VIVPLPAPPKIYHIVHVDRLASIVGDGFLWCDAEAQRRVSPGTAIGMSDIKHRRLTTRLDSHPDLSVGDQGHPTLIFLDIEPSR